MGKLQWVVEKYRNSRSLEHQMADIMRNASVKTPVNLKPNVSMSGVGGEVLGIILYIFFYAFEILLIGFIYSTIRKFSPL